MTWCDAIYNAPSTSPGQDQTECEKESHSINRNFILKCMEKYAQRKPLFQDTKWLLSNMPYRGRDDWAVWACAIARTTWLLHHQLAPWKSNDALFIFCGQRVWNLLKSTEEWRFSRSQLFESGESVWMGGKISKRKTKLQWWTPEWETSLRGNRDNETADQVTRLQVSHYWRNCCRIQHESQLCVQYCP